MKKMCKLFLGVVAIAAMTMFMSCEGPAGSPGVDGVDGISGVDGVDGKDGDVAITCLECHSEDAIIKVNSTFAQSQHKLGEFVDYAGGRGSCAQCHSSDGFIEFATLGSVAGSTLSNPGAWECKTCHGLHTTFGADDYAIRMTDPVKWIFDETQTGDLGGNSNLCGNCHQSRRAEPNAVVADSFAITSTHYGPHHGAQANVVYGVGFAEIAGTATYPDAASATHLTAASCTGCHMDQGDHSWNPSVASCTGCHSTLTDFDYGGVQTAVHGKLVVLRDLLIAKGVVAGDDVDGYHPVVGTYVMVEAQAFFNWVGLEEDRSLGVHNPKYVNALLDNTIEALK